MSDEADKEARRVLGEWARSQTPEQREEFSRKLVEGLAELTSCVDRNPDGKTWSLNDKGRALLEEGKGREG